MHITITVTGDKETKAKIDKLGDKLRSFQPEMTEIGHELKDYFAGRVFASKGGVLGVKWPALEDSYRKRKAVGNVRFNKGKGGFPGRGTLIRTGKMQGSFRMYATKNSVTIDNSAPYFKYHQSAMERTIIPYRPMMGINKDVKSIVSQVIEKGIRRKIDAVRL